MHIDIYIDYFSLEKFEIKYIFCQLCGKIHLWKQNPIGDLKIGGQKGNILRIKYMEIGLLDPWSLFNMLGTRDESRGLLLWTLSQSLQFRWGTLKQNKININVLGIIDNILRLLFLITFNVPRYLTCPAPGASCSALHEDALQCWPWPGGSGPRGAPQLHPGSVPSQGATSTLGCGLFVTQAALFVKHWKWGTVLWNKSIAVSRRMRRFPFFCRDPFGCTEDADEGAVCAL